MRKWIGLLLWVVGGSLLVFGLGVLLLALLFVVIASVPEKHTYTLDEIGQTIHSPIPTDATDVAFSSETKYGYFIKLSFKSSPTTALTFAKHICGETLYEGYDPFNAIGSLASKPDAVLVKWGQYAYFSYSLNIAQTIYGNRCDLGSSVVQVRVDQTETSKYQIKFELLGDGCAIKLTCSGYGIENAASHPLPQDSPVPLIIYGFEVLRGQSVLSGHILCAETDPGLYRDWGKPPFENNLNDASFELFVDDLSMGKATISKGWLSVDYSTGKFVGLHKLPEYYFQIDASAGEHQMSINVKTVAGKSYHYAWDFQVQPS